MFCVLAGFSVLVRAFRLCWALGLPLPEKYTELEARIGHRFKEQYSLADVVAEADRIPTWSAKRTSPFSAFALARIAGQVSSRQTRTAWGSCSTARLSGRWKVRPHRLKYSPTPGSVKRNPYSLKISRRFPTADSSWLRSDAPCSPDRLFCHVYGRAKTASQFIPGGPYSFVAVLETGATS